MPRHAPSRGLGIDAAGCQPALGMLSSRQKQRAGRYATRRWADNMRQKKQNGLSWPSASLISSQLDRPASSSQPWLWLLHGRLRQTGFTCRTPATRPHRSLAISIPIPGNSGFMSAPHCPGLPQAVPGQGSLRQRVPLQHCKAAAPPFKLQITVF